METNVQSGRDFEKTAEEMRKFGKRPMSDAEIAFLRDAQGFIEFAIRNGLSFLVVMSILGHDINSLNRHGLDYEEALAKGFWPKVSGYSKFTADSVGEPSEVGE